jgi:hypothetical protein
LEQALDIKSRLHWSYLPILNSIFSSWKALREKVLSWNCSKFGGRINGAQRRCVTYGVGRNGLICTGLITLRMLRFG